MPTLDDPAVVAHVQTRIPLRRAAEPREIAAAILFLASDAASYVTGTVLYVDRGVHGRMINSTGTFRGAPTGGRPWAA